MTRLTFGERLHVLRRRKELTMRQLGKAITCAASDIYRMEHGDVKNPSATRLAALAKALDVSMDVLWQGEEDEEKDT